MRLGKCIFNEDAKPVFRHDETKEAISMVVAEKRVGRFYSLSNRILMLTLLSLTLRKKYLMFSKPVDQVGSVAAVTTRLTPGEEQTKRLRSPFR